MGKGEKIQQGDGAGGELMQKMLSRSVLPHIRRGSGRPSKVGIPPGLLDDSSTIGDMVFTIDGHTVSPLFFPGGDIGSLSVFGTVNDLAVSGGVPEVLALSMVMEEGLEIEKLEAISRSIGAAAQRSNIEIVTGDTKVVEKGGVDGMIVTTAGLGRRHPELDGCLDKASESLSGRIGQRRSYNWLRDDAPEPGDVIILTGSVGDHGISLLSLREGYGFDSDLISDLAPLNGLMSEAIRSGGVVASKDLTRGGLANALNEWATKTSLEISVDQDEIPVKESVRSACEMLGLDPYEIGNEGKAIIAVDPDYAEDLLRILKMNEIGSESRIIGSFSAGRGRVILKTEVGGKRIMDPPYGDPIPRIC